MNHLLQSSHLKLFGLLTFEANSEGGADSRDEGGGAPNTLLGLLMAWGVLGIPCGW